MIQGNYILLPPKRKAKRQQLPHPAAERHAEILEREIANIREDLRTRTSTRGDDFVMTVKKETFTDRIKAGRALVFLAASITRTRTIDQRRSDALLVRSVRVFWRVCDRHDQVGLPV